LAGFMRLDSSLSSATNALNLPAYLWYGQIIICQHISILLGSCILPVSLRLDSSLSSATKGSSCQIIICQHISILLGFCLLPVSLWLDSSLSSATNALNLSQNEVAGDRCLPTLGGAVGWLHAS
jgi:hypothetical protein